MLGFIFVHGYKAINWTFLTEPPTDAMTRGGIFPAIVGTFYLTVGAILVALVSPWLVRSVLKIPQELQAEAYLLRQKHASAGRKLLSSRN